MPRPSLPLLTMWTAAGLLTADLAHGQQVPSAPQLLEWRAPASLTREEMKRARAVEKQHFLQADLAAHQQKAVVGLKDTAAGKKNLYAVTQGHVLFPVSDADASFRSAVVHRYEYATGLTYETVVDLNTNAVTSFMANPHDPIQLTGPETWRMLKMAAADYPELKSGTASYHFRVIQMADTQNPLYGHRLVILDTVRARLTIDLSEEKIAHREEYRPRTQNDPQQPAPGR